MAPASAPPTGTVTFLFTDIEGSTRLLKLLGPDYGEMLAEHQRLLRAAFAEHGGHEIDTQGDSFFVAFGRAKDAVSAALAAQHALREHPWPHDAEVRVRMGIHTGEPLAGQDRYVGLGVHRAARIGAVARGGQVLVSQTTGSLLRDDPLPEVTLRDLGERRLKDIDEPERVYELVAPGLAPTEDGRAGRMSRRRMVTGAALVAIAAGAGLGVVFSIGGRGAANAAGPVAPNEVGLINTQSGQVAARIPVGSAPNGVAAAGDAIWVTNTNDDSVARIDPSTQTFRQTIRVGGSPTGVAVSPHAVWVANGADGTVSRIDPASNQVVQTIEVGNGPSGTAYGDGAVWVANSADGTVSRIDPASGHVTGTYPSAIGVTAVVAADRIWTVSPSAGIALALDPRTGEVVQRVGVGVEPVAVAAGGGAIWVANRADGTVSKIDPRLGGVTGTIQVGRTPDALAADAKGVWVANAGDGTLSRIDGSSGSLVKTVSLENPPEGLALSPRGLYVAVRSNGTQHRDGTLRAIATYGGLDSLDPAAAYTPGSWAVLAMTNDGLVGFRRVGGGEGAQLVPDLATALPTPSDGGKTYTFTLRQGIRYSTGKPVQPADIRATIERALSLEPPSPTRTYFTNSIVGAGKCRPGKPCHLAKGIVADPFARTITFHLVGADPDFLSKLALPIAYAVPAGTSEHTDATRALPATGPYMVASYRPKGGLVRLVRNPVFREWSTDAQPDGFPDAITLHFTGTDIRGTRSVGAVLDGKADVASLSASPPIPKQELDLLGTRYPSQLRLSNAPATWYIFLNTRASPFNDVRVRRALAFAFDHQAFRRLLTREYATTCNILPPNFAGYHRSCAMYGSGGPAGLVRARQLVRASGTSGERVTVWAPAPVAFEARYVASLLNDLGYHAGVKTFPPDKIGEYFRKILDSRTRAQAGYLGWIADYPSSLEFFREEVSCGAFVPGNPDQSTNVSEFCDPAIDAEIQHAPALQVQDPPAAVALYQKLERDILAQAPLVPTYNGRNVAFVARRVGNYAYNPQWGVLFDQLWVK